MSEPITQLIKVDQDNQTAFVNLYNLFHHDRAIYLPDMYPSVDDEGYYDKANSLATLGIDPEKAVSYLIKYDGGFAGFVVFALPPIMSHHGCDYSIIDIFILNSHRGKGIGTTVCKQLFTQYAGKHQVEVVIHDQSARKFWERIIAKEGQPIKQEEKPEEHLVVYEFNIGG